MKDKVKNLFDIGYTDETGLKELVDTAADTMKEMQISREKDLINKFMMEIRKPDGGLGVYGESAIKSALLQKAVDLLLLSEDLNKVSYTYRCPGDGELRTIVKKQDEGVLCPKCSSVMTLDHQEDTVEVFYKLAEASGARVELISLESEEGKLLQKAFGGMAGVLRYVPKVLN